MKKCTKCNKGKERSCFLKDRSKKDGFYPSCKECNLTRLRQYYPENKDKYLRNNKKRYTIKKNEVLQKCKDYRKSDGRATGTKYYSLEENKEHFNIQKPKAIRKTNKEEQIERVDLIIKINTLKGEINSKQIQMDHIQWVLENF